MNPLRQLLQLWHERGQDSPIIQQAQTVVEDANRIKTSADRLLRDVEASEWMRRDRPIENDLFPDRRMR